MSRTIPYLNTLRRTIPYLNTLSRTIPYLNTLSRTRPYPKTIQSAANQIRVLRHSRALGSGGGHFSALGLSWLLIAYLNTWGSPPPPPLDLITHLLLTIPMRCLAAASGDICEELKLANTQKDSTAETNENTHTPQSKQRNDVESQTSSIKETSIQHPEPLRDSSEKLKLLANKYCAPITPRTVKTKAKERLTASQLKCNGDDHISLLTKTTSPLFGKRLWKLRHGQALDISVFHLNSWKVYLSLDLVNYLFKQPIWLGVYWAQYEKFDHKVYIKRRDIWQNRYGPWL